ncbi:catalase [Hydrogenophaga sp. RWCD_12]|uniref:catalase n=1 Tax=Hydrogenophaga sp. RWCD_12 TaxID=3391190 RepID=UPI0039854D1B
MVSTAEPVGIELPAETVEAPRQGVKQAAMAPALDTPLDRLTTNQGLLLSDNHNSLKAGARGPTLLEDFILREKITHFDHERIPERAVHARGAGAHGFFEVYQSESAITRAGFLCDPTVQTPVFARFSTVAGSRGSADTVRDARGFAVKFYTPEGNVDLVGNNIPVFFIQDAIKFPDLIHAVKPEPDSEMPQAASAHDTFWDFATLMPETTHMLMWVMSDRGIPRSLRMMEGFGVHTFRFVNAHGVSSFVKFHWKPKLGVHALTWDEAQALAGQDVDFHRRDLWEAIASGQFPEWELGVQVVPEADEHRFSFDLLDPTKLIPEELVPVRRIGRMVLNRNPDNFFAETEQVAFHPGHLVPGIDFSNDPLLQGRLFSYTDTQLSRLGGANFHELPINRGVCPMHNFQRDGMHRQSIGAGRVAYEPNTLANGEEFRVDGRSFDPVGPAGFTSYPEALEPPKLRARSASFDEHYAQARLFWVSQSAPEKDHLVAAFQFELSKLQTPAIRQRMVDTLAHVDADLAQRVAASLGTKPPDKAAATAWAGFREGPVTADLAPSAALSMVVEKSAGIATRKVAILVADGVYGLAVQAMQKALAAAGARSTLVGPTLCRVLCAEGGHMAVDATQDNAPSVLFDALYLPPMAVGADGLAGDPRALRNVEQACRHGKTVAASGDSVRLIAAAGVDPKRAGVLVDAADAVSDAFLAAFVMAMGQHRHWGA